MRSFRQLIIFVFSLKDRVLIFDTQGLIFHILIRKNKLLIYFHILGNKYMKKLILPLIIAFMSASAFAQGVIVVASQGHDYKHENKNGKGHNKHKHQKHQKHNKGPSDHSNHTAHEAYSKNHPNYHNHPNDPNHTHGYIVQPQEPNGIVINNNGITIPSITIK